jgi:uncharacterized membrane protein YeaQ/YmgE (transglycosylase-associated protein family)
MGIIAFLVIGLLAGFLARALVPGRQSMGLLPTLLLGCAGSFVGGFIGSLFDRRSSILEPRAAGFTLSVIGAILVLLLVVWAGRGRRVHA